jgi:hypothetical protein
VTATVTTVDEATGIVSLDRALHSDQVHITLVVQDPGTYRERLQVQPLAISHRSRRRRCPCSTLELYRLLYTPTDEADLTESMITTRTLRCESGTCWT